MLKTKRNRIPITMIRNKEWLNTQRKRLWLISQLLLQICDFRVITDTGISLIIATYQAVYFRFKTGLS